MLKPYLTRLLQGHDLTADETCTLLGLLTRSDISCFQAGAVLAALQMKGETAAELVGGARMLRRYGIKIHCRDPHAVDIVGTGGDGGISFNVSTTSAFIAAGAGCTVAKHGNRAVSGKSGAADVLAECGVNIQMPPEQVEECIDTIGIGFLFAQKLHPIMGKVAAMRRELGIQTIFNLLGPLANPAAVSHIVAGVYDASLTGLYARALMDLGTRRAMVVHGNDGLDEISCSGPTRVSEIRSGTITTYDIYPELLIHESYPLEEIQGGTPRENAVILKGVLSGEIRGAARAICLLNAAAAIYVAGVAKDLQEGVQRAEESIDSGKALQKLQLQIQAGRND